MPVGAAQPQTWGGETRHNVNIGVTLNKPDGTPAASPVQVQTVVGRPVVAGGR